MIEALYMTQCRKEGVGVVKEDGNWQMHNDAKVISAQEMRSVMLRGGL